MQIGRFEDIKAWQEARVLRKIIYDVIKSNKNFTGDYKFRGQIHSAAVSGMSNVKEPND